MRLVSISEFDEEREETFYSVPLSIVFTLGSIHTNTICVEFLESIELQILGSVSFAFYFEVHDIRKDITAIREYKMTGILVLNYRVPDPPVQRWDPPVQRDDEQP